MKAFGVILVSLLPVSLLHADGNEQQQLNRYLSLEQRIQQSCNNDVDSDLCQAWLHGMVQGVQAVGEQAEKLSADWALVHERDAARYPRAWLTRDVLSAVSCSPDTLDFVASYRAGADPGQSVNDHVSRNCGPIWAARHLDAPDPAMLTAATH